MPKPIQEQFGQTIIDAFAQFARADIPDVATLQATFFNHVTDAPLQLRMAETMYGARWIYKLGLALLVRNEEQMAHVRAQIIDYSSICEGLLRNMIDHALSRGMIGTKYRYADTRLMIKPFKPLPTKVLNHYSFRWMIDVAENEHIIGRSLWNDLDALRLERNTVHVHSRGYQAFLNRSKFAFDVACRTSTQTQAWIAANP